MLLIFSGCAHSVSLRAHDARLKIDGTTLRGEGTIGVRTTEREIVLDADVAAIESAMVAGQPIPFTHSGRRLTLQLPRTGEVKIALRWNTVLQNTWAGYATSKWLPTIFDSSQRATLKLKVEAPEGWAVAVSEPERPLPPFLFAFAAGPFESAERGVLRRLGGNDAVLERTEQMIAFMKDRTGVDLPSKSYTQVFVDGDEAQEAAGLSLLSSAHADGTDDWAIIHELAHQWFGVALACLDFDDFWLNEGFATFFTAAWKEHAFGRAAYDSEVERWKARAARVEGTWPLSLAPPGKERPHTPDAQLQPRGVTYSRGALVLDQLRRELGDEVFWNVIKRYTIANLNRDVTSEDFRGAVEQVTGRSYREWFQRFVY